MAKDPREYGYEGEMVMSQLKGIMNHAEQMHNILKPDTDLPEWVQSKVTLAYDYMQTAADYMATEMNEEKLPFKGPYKNVGQRKDEYGNVVKNVPKYLAKKAMKKLTKEEAEPVHSVHVKTYDSQGEKQMNSPEFKKHVTAHGGEMDYASDKGAAFKFKSHSHAAAFHRGVQSKFKELDSEHDVHEEVAVNAAGAGNVAGIGVGPQGEPGVHMNKKKKTVLARFKRFTKA